MKHDYTDDEIRSACKDVMSLRAFLDALPTRSAEPAEIAALKAALAESEKQFQAKVDEIALLLDERDKAQGILKDCLAVMPFGNIKTHTVENLPHRIADLASEIASLSLENERLKAELAALRQSTQSAQPILADDGRSLGQVAFDGAKWSHNWEASTIKDKWQRAAQAVAAVVLAQAVRRMEAVPKVELRCFYNGGRTIPEGLEFVRARLIAAAKGEGQAMAKNIPGDKCPLCGAEEVESNTPRTAYACGSSDYDGRPETFHPGDQCDGLRVVINEVPQGEKQPDLSGESEKQPLPCVCGSPTDVGTVHRSDGPCYQAEAQPTTSPSWTPAVGDVVSSIPEMALGGQMYWRDLALQLARVWWKCYKIGASLQHGDLDKDIAFSIVCERHGGRVFHSDTPENAWNKAEEWLLSPDRENFPAACLTPTQSAN